MGTSDPLQVEGSVQGKDPAQMKGSRRAWGGAILLFLFAAGLRARGIEHGMPHNYVPDTHIVRAALGMAKDKNPVPPVGKYSTYPNLLPYCLLPLYGAHFVQGKFAGDWSGAQEYGDHILEHPSEVHRIARWLVLLFGALTPIAVLLAARSAGLERGAWFAAWFAASGLMHVHFSVQERPWVPMMFFAALSAWPAALYVRKPALRTLVLAGLCAALSAACHQSGFFVLAIPGLAWLVSPLGWNREGLLARLKHGVLCVGAFFVLAILVGYPSYLIYGAPTADQTIGGDTADISFNGQSLNLDRNLGTFPSLAKAFFGYGPVLTLFLLAGFGTLLKRRAALPAVLFCGGWALFFMTSANEHTRYLLPVAVLGCLPAGMLVERLWSRGPGVRVALCLFALFPAAQSWRLGSVLAQPDTRESGERWLQELDGSAMVLIDRYGPIVDLDQSSLELLMNIREASGSSLGSREARRLSALNEGELTGGVRAIYASDLMKIEELDGTIALRKGLHAAYGETPAAALAALGVTHLLLVNRLQEGLEGNLLRGLLKDQTALVTAGKADSSRAEFRLPMELKFPLTSLWSIERPGPWMGLYDLR